MNFYHWDLHDISVTSHLGPHLASHPFLPHIPLPFVFFFILVSCQQQPNTLGLSSLHAITNAAMTILHDGTIL